MFSDILYTVHICTQSSKMRFQAHIDDVVEDTKHGILWLVPSARADFAAELTNISQCTSMWDGVSEVDFEHSTSTFKISN